MIRKCTVILIVLLGSNVIVNSPVKAGITEPVEWLIVGAGPAGLIVCAVLLDLGVDPQTIMIIDPEFDVGRMGQFYASVESNNKAKEFVALINASPTFRKLSCPAIDALKKLNPEQPCLLSSIVDPLRCITAYLRSQVASVQDRMINLASYDNLWQVTTEQHGIIGARHVILATGAQPKKLNFNVTQKIIPLDDALNPETLRTTINRKDIVGIIGGAHSAILLLKYLSTMNVRHIYNFYRHPISYAIGEGCWALNQLGIKGTTGEWAKNVLEKNPPANISRIRFNTPSQLPWHLRRTHCTKLIYAVGFESNPLPAINGTQAITSYNGQTGSIAPGLFGIGIAFPEYKIDDGHPRYIVGLNCFMDYAQRIVPQWLQKKYIHEQSSARVFLKDIVTIDTL